MILFQTLAEKLKTCKYGRVYHGCKNEKWKSHRIRTKLHLLEYRSPGDNLLYRISSSVRDAQVGWVMSDNCIIISIVTPNCKQTIITMITTNIIFNGQPHPVPCHCKKKIILIAFRKYLSINQLMFIVVSHGSCGKNVWCRGEYVCVIFVSLLSKRISYNTNNSL